MNTGLLVTVTALVLGSSAVYAVTTPGLGGCDSGWGKGARHGGMHPGMMQRVQAKDPAGAAQMQQQMLDRLEQQLSLTEQQRQQIEALRGPDSAQMPGRHAQMQQFRTQMQALDPAAADYLDRVAVLAEQKAALMSQQMVERAKHHAKIFALLTPEQQQAFRQMKQRRGDHQGRHHGPW